MIDNKVDMNDNTQQSYEQKLACPVCLRSGDSVKNGIMRGKQRYLCKKCRYNYTQEKAKAHSVETVLKAHELYQEGKSFREIGKILKVSDVIVGTHWLKNTYDKRFKERALLSKWYKAWNLNYSGAKEVAKSLLGKAKRPDLNPSNPGAVYEKLKRLRHKISQEEHIAIAKEADWESYPTTKNKLSIKPNPQFSKNSIKCRIRTLEDGKTNDKVKWCDFHGQSCPEIEVERLLDSS